MFNYYHRKWKRKQKHILRPDRYKDRVAAMYDRTKEATTAHHIYPAEEYPEYARCNWNPISASRGNHNKLENGRAGELTTLGRQLMDITVPRKKWKRK